MVSTAVSARNIRHCCSVRPWLRNDGRNWRMTASRARSSDIGSERENSRIGPRRGSSAPSCSGRDPFGDLLPAIFSGPLLSGIVDVAKDKVLRRNKHQISLRGIT
jgi:hypothetical protein